MDGFDKLDLGMHLQTLDQALKNLGKTSAEQFKQLNEGIEKLTKSIEQLADTLNEVQRHVRSRLPLGGMDGCS